MTALSTLQPPLLWQWFERICAVPHPSGHEEVLAQLIVNWAKSQRLWVERDEVGNILIRKPATCGMEDNKPVILQAHLDMVPQANEGIPHDFIHDPIQPYVEQAWVTAKGTTLGADNGIGMASALAVLESRHLAHPPLEVLLTMKEETGMVGAIGLRLNWLQGEILINTDTEEFGEIYIGCAGGENANLTFPIQRQVNTFSHSMQLNLKGLCGGHSGCDIHTGRGNAIKLLARFLTELQQNLNIDFSLNTLYGGSVRNAIPREATAIISFNGSPDELQSAVDNFAVLLRQELLLSEPNLHFICHMLEKPHDVFTPQTAKRLIYALNLLPNGVIRYSEVINDVVETSLNIGVLTTEQAQVCGTILIRSLIDSSKMYVGNLLSSLAALTDGKVEFSDSYPGWQPIYETEILALAQKIYTEQFRQDAKIKVIHAGLECGLLKKNYPNVEMISIGPTIRDAHSPAEKVNIASVQAYWHFLTEILAKIPPKSTAL